MFICDLFKVNNASSIPYYVWWKKGGKVNGTDRFKLSLRVIWTNLWWDLVLSKLGHMPKKLKAQDKIWVRDFVKCKWKKRMVSEEWALCYFAGKPFLHQQLFKLQNWNHGSGMKAGRPSLSLSLSLSLSPIHYHNSTFSSLKFNTNADFLASLLLPLLSHFSLLYRSSLSLSLSLNICHRHMDVSIPISLIKFES